MKKKIINKEINFKPVFSISSKEIKNKKNEENFNLKKSSKFKGNYNINIENNNINHNYRKERNENVKRRHSIIPNFNSYERFKKKLINLLTENNVSKFKRTFRRENTTYPTFNNKLRNFLKTHTKTKSNEYPKNDTSFTERRKSFNPFLLHNTLESENLKKKGLTFKSKKKKILNSFEKEKEKEKEKNDYDNFNVLSSSVYTSENQSDNDNENKNSIYIYINKNKADEEPKKTQFSRHSIIQKEKKSFKESEENPIFSFIEENSNSSIIDQSNKKYSKNNKKKRIRKNIRFNTMKENVNIFDNNINFIQMFEYEQKTYRKEMAYNKTIRTLGYNMKLIKNKMNKEHGKKLLLIQKWWLKRFYLRLAKIVKIQRNFKKYLFFKKIKLQKMILFSDHIKIYYFKLFFKHLKIKNQLIKLLKLLKRFVYYHYFKYLNLYIIKKNQPILLNKEVQFDPIPIIKENIININDSEEKQLKRMFGDSTNFVGLKVFPRPSVEVSGNRYVLLRKYNISKMIEKNNINNQIIFNDNIKYICHKINKKEKNNNKKIKKKNKTVIINNVNNNKIDSFYSHRRNLSSKILINENDNFKKIFKNNRNYFFITKNLYKKNIINCKIKKLQKKIKQFLKKKKNIKYNKKKQLNYFIVYFITIFNQNVQKFFLYYFYNKYKLNTNENSSNLIINDEIFENESYSNNYSRNKKYYIESSNLSNINSE